MEGEDQTEIQETEHAMIVAWGYFSRLHRLAQQLREHVHLPRHHENIPMGDLILEFGLLLLSGSTQIQDLNLGPRPLVQDTAVGAAWDIVWGHYTSVSRILKRATPEVVSQVVEVLDQFSRPFIEQEVAALAAQGQEMLLYADLSGREVSAYSQSYTEARWGHMGNAVALGYQHAVISMRGQTYRLHLAGFLHPGDTVSENCLRELVQAAERRLGCRPRRRVELVTQRIKVLAQKQQPYLARLHERQQVWQAEQTRQQQLQERLAQQEQLLQELSAQQGEKLVGPYSRLAQARRQRESWRVQWVRAGRRADLLQGQIAHTQQHLAQLVQEEERLRTWLAVLQADNENQPNPVPMHMLIDGGFSGGDNLTYLIEMGYNLLAVGKGNTAAQLRKELPTDAVWTLVTPQVQLWEGEPATVGRCSYPLRRVLQHWQAGEQERYSMFVQYPAETDMPLPALFDTYHQRQQVEAGVKQGKSVFGGRGVRIRSAAGLELLNQFAFVFWPNFVHWATDWLRSKVCQSTPPFEAALRTVKTQVRVGAHASATLITTPHSRVLAFSLQGPYPGVRLELEGVYVFQLPLPLFQCTESDSLGSLFPRRLLSPPDG